MRILCKSNKLDTVPVTRKINIIGKYLYKNIDGAFKYVQTSNMFDIYFTLLYQSEEDRINNDTVNEMTININLTTYQNKIRVDVIEVTPEERTIGYDLYPPEKLQNLEAAKDLIFKRVVNRVSKVYEDYTFLF